MHLYDVSHGYTERINPGTLQVYPSLCVMILARFDYYASAPP